MSFLVRNFMNEEVDKIFNALLTDPSMLERNESYIGQHSSYRQETNEHGHIIEIPMVGVDKKDLTVEVENNLLTVYAKPQEKSYFVKDFKKSWTVSQSSDIENMTADLKNGLLRVNIPKKKENNKKVVNITG